MDFNVRSFEVKYNNVKYTKILHIEKNPNNLVVKHWRKRERSKSVHGVEEGEIKINEVKLTRKSPQSVIRTFRRDTPRPFSFFVRPFTNLYFRPFPSGPVLTVGRSGWHETKGGFVSPLVIRLVLRRRKRRGPKTLNDAGFGLKSGTHGKTEVVIVTTVKCFPSLLIV